MKATYIDLDSRKLASLALIPIFPHSHCHIYGPEYPNRNGPAVPAHHPQYPVPRDNPSRYRDHCIPELPVQRVNRPFHDGVRYDDLRDWLDCRRRVIGLTDGTNVSVAI